MPPAYGRAALSKPTISTALPGQQHARYDRPSFGQEVVEDAVFAFITVWLYRTIKRNWYRPWDRATVTGSFTWVGTLITSFVGWCIFQAIIAPHAAWSANDGIPVFIGSAVDTLDARSPGTVAFAQARRGRTKMDVAIGMIADRVNGKKSR